MGFVLQDAVMKMNHSFTPNVHTVNNKEKNWKALKIVASRDIEAGEKLCSNYSFGSKKRHVNNDSPQPIIYPIVFYYFFSNFPLVTLPQHHQTQFILPNHIYISMGLSSLLKPIFTILIPILLLLITFQTYNYALSLNLLSNTYHQSINYDQYQLRRTKEWSQRFQHLENQGENYNQVQRSVIEAQGHFLVIRRQLENYFVEYQYQVDGDIVESVSQVAEKGDQTDYSGRYFLVKYHKFIEVVYFNLTIKPQTVNDGSSLQRDYESEVCLQLPIESTEKVLYHVDADKNIWIVSLSLNKIIFVQIYSCKENKLLKQFRYALNNQSFVSQLHRIVKQKDRNCMVVQVMTYGLKKVDVQFCNDVQGTVKEVASQAAIEMHYQMKGIADWSSYGQIEQGQELNELYKLLNYVLGSLGIQYHFQASYSSSYVNPIQNIQQHFDTVSVDQKNNFLVQLAREKTHTGVIALDKYLINAKTPLFHSNDKYNQLAVLQILQQESKGKNNPKILHRYIDTKLNETKKVFYKAAFKTFPNIKIEHLGIGDKSLAFWPEQRLQEKDYLAIRTQQGALVTQKTQLKGVYDKLPVSVDQVYQRVDSKPVQVVPGIYQYHAKEQSLLSRPVISDKYKTVGKVQLVNLLGGKIIATHYIKLKDGYRYTSAFLLNNEWWVLEYNPQKKVSVAKKYELFVMVSSPDKIHVLQQTYGNTSTLDHANGQDDLSFLMQKFTEQHNNGFILLNVYRCIDEYYYIEYTDADGSVYGIARIHFQRISNRRLRQGQSIGSDPVKKSLMLQQHHLNAPRFDTKPHAVALKGLNIFKYVNEYFQLESNHQSLLSFCEQKTKYKLRKLEKLEKFYYIPQQSYIIGNQGCNIDKSEQFDQTIYAFNMRNMIIQGRIDDRPQQELKKRVVYLVFASFPTYCLLLALCLCLCRSKKAEQKEEVTKKTEKQKKNK